MKKKVFVLLAMLLLTGCTSIEKMPIESVVDNGVNAKLKLANQYRSGYKYYLPKGLRIIDKADYNEKIKSGDYTYYLYVDVVSYYNKVIESYKVKEEVYHSQKIDNKDKYGYLEVNKTDENKYLVEIMYNYAKIEVIVREKDINVAVANAISVLASVDYNDTILSKLVGEETSSFNELEYDIFTTVNDSSYLQYKKEEDEEYEEEIHDRDLVN